MYCIVIVGWSFIFLANQKSKDVDGDTTSESYLGVRYDPVSRVSRGSHLLSIMSAVQSPIVSLDRTALHHKKFMNAFIKSETWLELGFSGDDITAPIERSPLQNIYLWYICEAEFERMLILPWDWITVHCIMCRCFLQHGAVDVWECIYQILGVYWPIKPNIPERQWIWGQQTVEIVRHLHLPFT